MTLLRENGIFLIFLLAGFTLVASQPQEVDCRALGEQDEQYCEVVCNGTAKLSTIGLPLCVKDKDIIDTAVQTTCICGEKVGGEGVIQENGGELTVMSVCHSGNVESSSNCQPCMAATEVRYECRVEETAGHEDTRPVRSSYATSKYYCACASPGAWQSKDRGSNEMGDGKANGKGGLRKIPMAPLIILLLLLLPFCVFLLLSCL